MKFVAGCVFFGLSIWGGPRAEDTAPALAPVSAESAFLQRIAERAAPGVFAAAFVDLQTHRTVEWAGERPMPMQSVFKAVLAAAVLSQVDAGTLTLSDILVLKQTDLSPPYSPIADAWPQPDHYTIAELLKAAAGGSDNTAADVLMKSIGGPEVVTRFLRAKSIEGIRVDRYEREFQVEAIGLGPFRVDWLGDAALAQALQTVPPRNGCARCDDIWPMFAIRRLRVRLRNSRGSWWTENSSPRRPPPSWSKS